jgi:hypothetical protein
VGNAPRMANETIACIPNGLAIEGIDRGSGDSGGFPR